MTSVSESFYGWIWQIVRSTNDEGGEDDPFPIAWDAELYGGWYIDYPPVKEVIDGLKGGCFDSVE